MNIFNIFGTNSAKNNKLELDNYSEYISNLTKEKNRLDELKKKYSKFKWIDGEIINLNNLISISTSNKIKLNKEPDGQESEDKKSEDKELEDKKSATASTSGGTRKKRKNKKRKKHKKTTLKH